MEGRDMLLASFDFSDPTHPYMTVGRRAPGDIAELVRVIEGEEAKALYEMLLGKYRISAKIATDETKERTESK